MTLDATVAGAAANSYITLEEADAFAALDLGPDAELWLSGTDGTREAAREAALVQATTDIDAYLRPSLELPYGTTQALRFPRSTDVVADLPVLPVNLTLATFRQAKYRLANAKLMAEARSRQARELASFSDDDGSGTRTLHAERWPTEVRVLLDPIIVATRRGSRFFSVRLTNTSRYGFGG